MVESFFKIFEKEALGLNKLILLGVSGEINKEIKVNYGYQPFKVEMKN